MADMKEIREADERWLRLLFGEPYEAKFQSGAVYVYDGNGDEILTYTAGVLLFTMNVDCGAPASTALTLLP